jgi:hypothetical protein
MEFFWDLNSGGCKEKADGSLTFLRAIWRPAKATMKVKQENNGC